MQEVIEQISFSGIAPEDLEAFRVQKDKILSAMKDRLARDTRFASITADAERLRISQECATIFLENFLATAKYNLPAALLDYLDWLRGFLSHRSFPSDFLPAMISATKIAAHAFMEDKKSDDLAAALTELQRRESAINEGAHS